MTNMKHKIHGKELPGRSTLHIRSIAAMQCLASRLYAPASTTKRCPCTIEWLANKTYNTYSFNQNNQMKETKKGKSYEIPFTKLVNVSESLSPFVGSSGRQKKT